MIRTRTLLLSGLLLVSPSPTRPAAPPTRKEAPLPRPAAERLFATRVLPVLRERCFGCHGDDPKAVRGGLDLRSRAGLLAGGDSGEPSVVPAAPGTSPLVRAAAWDGLKMPPKEKDRLSPAQVADLRRWVAAGAPWPDEKEIAKLQKEGWAEPSVKGGVAVRTRGGQSEEWTNRRYDPADLWAYRPVRRPSVPRTPEAARNPVDAFLNDRLAGARLQPAGRADRRTLARRVTFDLTGLPPTPAEVRAFVADERPDAYERLVERLLASPAYGEQAARLWLDVARYADSAGFSNDFERPHAWRYRDYVVRAFNADKPYDAFVVEQLAGDELGEKDAELLVAVGFLRMGPWEHTGMSVAAVTRQQFLDDVTNSVGETFLATGMSCCRCHDHKFDPLPTVDYYALQAVFAPVQFADRDAVFLPGESTADLADGRARVEGLLKAKGDLQLALEPGATAKEREEAGLGLKKVGEKRTQALRHAVEAFKPLAMSVYNGPPAVRASPQPYHPMPKSRVGKVQDVFVLTGGSLESPGAKVGPGVLSAVAGKGKVPEATDGRRLALARWVASKDNPLTARVMVNRIWQQHFGTGLAANPNNFGKTGKKPSHPELLDWLAAEFVDRGWSLKALHRLLVTTDAYTRAGAPKDARAAEARDPDNRLLGHYPPRRLTAEELRDTTLAVSGELSRPMGGVPARPELHPEVAFQPRHVMGSVAPAYQPSRTPAERNRRTLYALRLRTLRDPMLEVFDQPSPDLSCERRAESTVTPQTFALFNGRSSHDRALAFARRLEREAKTPSARVDRAFWLAFGRSPTAAERAACLKHVERMEAHHREHKPKREAPPTVIVREKVEEMTGTKVRWKERLDVYERYVADLKPWDVGPETRALAELCLVLLNANEFAYVY